MSMSSIDSNSLPLLGNVCEFNVECWCTYPDGKEECIDKTHNLVLYKAQEIIVAAIAAGLTGSKDGFISKYHAGTTVNPKAPETGNSSLEDQVPFVKNLVKNNVSVSGTRVTFSLIMEKGEGNKSGEVNYTELGLCTHQGKMLARVLTSKPIPKTPDLRLEWRWSLGY